MGVTENITKIEHIFLDKYGNQHKTLEEAIAADKRDNNPGMAERASGDEGNEGA